MLCEDQVINRYGAKFFIGQLVRIVSIHGDTQDEDVNKLGVIDGIVGSIEDGFSVFARQRRIEYEGVV